MSDTESLEMKMKRLDAILKVLEGGGLALEKTLELYEEGVRLAQECEKLLEDAQARIEILTRTPEGMRTLPFGEGEE